jgi:hypothetical protein
MKCRLRLYDQDQNSLPERDSLAYFNEVLAKSSEDADSRMLFYIHGIWLPVRFLRGVEHDECG